MIDNKVNIKKAEQKKIINEKYFFIITKTKYSMLF
jgi:hypothetical protein